MKKAIGQTVRDLKRGVNKKVLKVPTIEQKVLDATSNESWGPHGSLLADIAQATRNYHEYQMIMSIIWKRINDTGKNWRHVYKALIVLEYLVAHGSERVIEEIKEHAYQISTLSDFQYIDSSSRDQGSNVRRKSQALVNLVNDKERIEELRQKAAANRDKFRGPSPSGGMYRSSSNSNVGEYRDQYDDDRYDDRNSYDRDRDWGSRDDDRSSRNGDPYGRDVDRYSRDSDECNGRDNNRNDDFRGRGQSVDNYHNESRGRSSNRDSAYEDDSQNISRGIDRKFSEQNLGAPPSYEEAINDTPSPVHNDGGDGKNSMSSAPKNSSPPPAPKTSSPPSAPKVSSPPPGRGPTESDIGPDISASLVNQEPDAFDEFDPRDSFLAVPPPSASSEMDLLGDLSNSFLSCPLAIMPSESGPTHTESDASQISDSACPTFAAPQSASSVTNQPFGDPFGDSPFKAFPATNNVLSQHHDFAPAASFQSTELSQQIVPNPVTASNFDFGDSFYGLTYATPNIPNAQPPLINTQYSQEDNTDILADILPPSGPTQPNTTVYEDFHMQPALNPPVVSHMFHQTQTGSTPAHYYNGNFHPQFASVPPMSHVPSQTSNSTFQGSLFQQTESVPADNSLAPFPKPANKKFDPESTVWADTLNRGLVNLNISGPKINPLSDIGIDFDAINRKEKRMEKVHVGPVTSNVSMGKAMGSGSGIGRAGASVLRSQQNPGMNMDMGMNMGGGPGMNMGMGMYMGGGPGMNMGQGMRDYGGMNQQSMGMGQSSGYPQQGYNQGMNRDYLQHPYGGYQ